MDSSLFIFSEIKYLIIFIIWIIFAKGNTTQLLKFHKME